MKLRRGPAVLLCCIAMWLTAGPAHAQEPDRKVYDPKLSITAGFAYMTGAQKEASFERKDIYAGAGYRIHPLVDLSLSLHVGNTTFAYRVDRPADKLTFQGELERTAEPWLNPGIKVRLMRSSKLTLHLFGDLELPLERGKPMDITRAQITAPQLGEVDATKFFNEHVTTSYAWYSFSVGTTARLRLGAIEPRLDLGVRRFYGGVDLKLDQQSQSILKLLGYDGVLKTSYPVEYVSPVAAIGGDWKPGRHVTISATGMAFPAASGWFFGTGASVQLQW